MVRYIDDGHKKSELDLRQCILIITARIAYVEWLKKCVIANIKVFGVAFVP